MRALVTGATGFIGGELVVALVSRGHTVSCLLRDDRAWRGSVPEGVSLLASDGTTEAVAAAIGAASPHVVFHLASQFIAEHTTADVTALVEGNVLFGTQVLEGMRLAGVDRMVNVSTSWLHYGGAEYDPVCLYAATKRAFEDVAAYYRAAADLRMVSLELFDTYGPRDPRPKLVPALVALARGGGSLDLSPGEQLIDLVFVDDVVSALLIASDHVGEAGASNPHWVVASGAPVTLRGLVEVVSRLSGHELDVRFGRRQYREREVMSPWAGGAPVPGWRPAVELEDGLRRVLAAEAEGGEADG